MKTYVYIDAFNLYFGCVKNTPYKWLDLSKLCAILLPQHQIDRIKYFTAHVKALPSSPDAPLRQQVYLRALQTLTNLEIIYGHFLSHSVRMPLAHPVVGQPRTVEVLKTEEKGSDVNLAVQLLHDAYRNRYESAVVISGDSDLLAAVQIVKNELGKPVGLGCFSSMPPSISISAQGFLPPVSFQRFLQTSTALSTSRRSGKLCIARVARSLRG